MDKNKKHIYVRLMSYDAACDVVNHFNGIYDNGKYSYANITVGGFSIKGYENEIEYIKNYIKDNFKRYEFSEKHPVETTKKIVENLKTLSVIKDK